jgi:hypothetical protein
MSKTAKRIASTTSEMHHATANKAMREFALTVGKDRTNTAWILTSYDVFVANPFYAGAPQPYPEDGQGRQAPHSGNRMEWSDLPF